MYIEATCSKQDLAVLFQHIQDTWQHLGEDEPYWSVITSDEFHSTNIDAVRDKFYASGRADVERMHASLERNGIDYSRFTSCLEYGCGLGRVTRWLCERFEVVYGYDISRTHLKGTKEYLRELGIRNALLRHVERVDQVLKLPKAHVVYSILVLQHNPPPLIRLMIRSFTKALHSGGVAFFQVPTYRLDYSFSVQRYLKEDVKSNEMMEMHILPQKEKLRSCDRQAEWLSKSLRTDAPGRGTKRCPTPSSFRNASVAKAPSAA